jgi:hypothetical protein
MAIFKLVASAPFDPEKIEAMITAYEEMLSDLLLVDRSDPLTDLIATSIITAADTGERDPEKIKQRALNALGLGKIDAG